jgi:hypothetical protein
VEAHLVQAKLDEADLSSCNVSYANLNRARLQKANLTESNFANARLVEAELRSADLSQADFTNADMGKASLVHARCAGTDFRNAVLAEANLQGAYLRGALFRGANLTGAQLADVVGLDPAWANGQAEPQIERITPKQKLQGIALGVKGDAPVDYNAPRVLDLSAKAPRKSKYHPPLRRIPAVIFTTGGWIRGVFHVPVMHGFLEHLNLVGEMLKLTNVNLPYLKMELRFFGLKRNKALLVLPDCDPKLLHLPEPTAEYHVHRVSFLLEGGTVTGSIAIEEDIRVSDYLANHNAFLVLKNCRFGAHDAPPEEESHFPFLLVNCGAVVGASDERMHS